MAVAHSLLSQSGWQNVGLSALVEMQLAPYATAGNVTIKGEDFKLSAAETQPVAMALHELVTNAAKYGSLSVPNGRICVTWDRQSLDGEVKLVFEWRELGGPPVAAKASSGYGTSLIRDLIPHELEGTVDLVFAPEGDSGQPGDGAVRARPDQDHRDQGSGIAALRGETDHPRQEGHAAQPA